MAKLDKPMASKEITALHHTEAHRRNIPTAEYQSIMDKEAQKPVRLAYERRNRDLDPQLMWRGKDEQDAADLIVHAPPLYIQEKVHPKALIEDLKRQSKARQQADTPSLFDWCHDFNGIPEGADKTDFYQHDGHWSNRMILGDSLQVMASLAEREGLRGQVQCIYFDPPYGIKFNSNFQWSTTSRDVKDGNKEHITREPEMVKAFRDTWRDGIHSYLSYIRDRLTVARDLLHERGSIFIQISDENLHLVTSILDEIFGVENKVSIISFRKKTMPFGTNYIEQMSDFIIWYAKKKNDSQGRPFAKYRKLFRDMNYSAQNGFPILRKYDGTIEDSRKFDNPEEHGYLSGSKSMEPSGTMATGIFKPVYQGKFYSCPKNGYACDPTSMERLIRANRVLPSGNLLRYLLFANDKPKGDMTTPWGDTAGADNKSYVVQTNTEVIKRCILMTTDPGDLVLDPTCGSGTTAYVAEQWGRRWITVDTSRVALALARSRIMGARYPFYLLADTPEGQKKEADVTRTIPSSKPTFGNIRHGFVYERVPHITLKSIANNAEIDVIWEKYQAVLEPLRERLNTALGVSWQEWEIPREYPHPAPLPKGEGEETKPSPFGRGLGEGFSAQELHTQWWDARINRQKEIDASIAAKADTEYLYDKPFEDKKKVRVAGPFTVESLSPHRMLGVDEHDNLIDDTQKSPQESHEHEGFAQMILASLRDAGVQQAHKEDKITFQSLTPWPGHYICAEGQYQEGDTPRRAAIFIGPEFGTVARQNLVEAAREAGDGDFDVVIACAFSFDAHSSEFNNLGRIRILKARMNADLHMVADLKSTGKGNLFVIFGEPDIEILGEGDQLRVKIHGVDVFDPRTGDVRSDGADGIACWFLDTDYNGESFFVRHAYFLGANDPYKSLKTTLKAEIDHEAWITLNSDTSRPFTRPASGRIAVKVINHLGDEVMKVFGV